MAIEWKVGDEVEVSMMGTITKIELNDSGFIEYRVRSAVGSDLAWVGSYKIHPLPLPKDFNGGVNNKGEKDESGRY